MAVEKPAIEGGTPVRPEILPYATQWIQQEEIDEVVDTLKSTWITTGPRTKKFSEEFSKYIGSEHAVALNSGTSAMNLSVIGLGIGPGDEVITTPMTFVATTLAIIHAGGTPVFTDIREDNYNIDVETIESKVTERTKAIIPVHYGGNPVDLDPILDIADKHGLKVIEDAAHAAGARYKGRKIGTFGDLTCFSFNAIKNMTTSEGGMITTDDGDVAEHLKALSFFGINQDAYKRSKSSRPWHYDIEEPGFKYNMPDLLAALGLVQLKRLDEFNAIRTRLVETYNEAFSALEEIITPTITEGSEPSHHIYVIRIRENALKVDRDHVLAALRAENIFANIHYTPVYRHPFFSKIADVDMNQFPVCERVYKWIITLPLFPTMTEEDQQSVIDAVTKIVCYYRK